MVTGVLAVLKARGAMGVLAAGPPGHGERVLLLSPSPLLHAVRG